MLFENQTFTTIDSPPNNGGNNVYRYCTFESMYDTPLSQSQSIFDSCEFIGVEQESTMMFESATLIGCAFRKCTFKGIAFFVNTFVECSFEDCLFAEDYNGEKCTFNDNKWYGCTRTNCEGFDADW